MEELELHITKIVLSEDDIKLCIKNELLKKGLKVIGDIEIQVGTMTTGWGLMGREVPVICDTIIQCESFKLN